MRLYRKEISRQGGYNAITEHTVEETSSKLQRAAMQKIEKHRIWLKWRFYIASPGVIVFLLGSLLWNKWLALAGLNLLLAANIVKICLWRCPCCNKPIGWVPTLRGKYPYKCTYCGQEFMLK